VGIAKTVKMGVKHQISSLQQIGTIIDPVAKWSLTQERTNKGIAELLLFLLFVLLFTIQSLKNFVRNIGQVKCSLMTPSQETSALLTTLLLSLWLLLQFFDCIETSRIAYADSKGYVINKSSFLLRSVLLNYLSNF
jgi:hypothetical protein